jgi:outer membrane protein OmpA-like peptidoglycan-associated protein
MVKNNVPRKIMMSNSTEHVLFALAWIFAMLLTACSTTQELIVLLPEEDGTLGSVAIGDGDRSVIIDVPLAAAKIDARGRVQQEAITQAEVNRIFEAALAAQPPKLLSFILYFEEGKAQVTSESQATLEALLAEVARRSAVEVQVTGHTDRVGSVADNDRLSLARAQAVREILAQLGLRSDFIRAVGRGEREPLVSTPDDQPEPRNRRVEVIVR